jgi:two-component system, LytTR family, sensor histidine kinase AlgZ
MRVRIQAILRAAAFNQAIALPVGLIMGASNGRLVAGFTVATVFSQSIGALCWGSASLVGRRFALLSPGGRRAAWLMLYFVDGVAGAAFARWFCVAVLGYNMGDGQSFMFSLAIGASIAVLVGMAMLTAHELRTALESTQQAKVEAELAALQARINPHFLFNTLNSIASLIAEDPARAEEATLQLSSLFRYALQANTRSMVTVDEEMEIVRRYLEIEKIRLGERLRYEIAVAPELSSQEIPALLLQPLVENAIKHGIAPEVQGGTVTITGQRVAGEAIFEIADSGRGGPAQSSTGVGLDNVRKRLEGMFGSGASVTLSRRDGLTTTRVVFPVKA